MERLPWVAALLVAAACGGGGGTGGGGTPDPDPGTPGTPGDAAVEVVEVTLAPPVIGLGQTARATAVARDATGEIVTGRAVAWGSSDPARAEVDPAGVVTGHGAGLVHISATIDGKTGDAPLTILSEPVSTAPVASVDVMLSPPTVQVGGTSQAEVLLRDAGGDALVGRTVAWSSSDTAVATVDATGLVTSHAAGTANITATSEGVSGGATLTVSAPVASVAVTLASTSLTVGETTQATPVVRDADGNVLEGRAVAWSTSDAGIAAVDAAGLVTAVGAGTATITATSEGQSGAASVSVRSGRTGLRVALATAAPAGELFVAVDGGGLATPRVARLTGAGLTSGTLAMGVPAGGPYRVRAVAVDPLAGGTELLASATGQATGVTVVQGDETPVSVALAPPAVQVSAPAAAEPGTDVTVEFTVTDAGAALDGADAGVAYATAPFADGGGKRVAASRTPGTPPTVYDFVARLPAPSTPGTIHFQVYARTFDLSIPGTPRSGWLVSPSTARSEPLGQIAVPSVSTGLTVQLASPAPTDEFVVTVDGGAIGTPLVASVVGSGLTTASLTMGVPAGGPYRVRAVALDPSSSGAARGVIAGGVVDGVSVASGALAPVSLAVTPFTVQVTAPASAEAGSEITVDFSVGGPTAVLDLAGGVAWSTTPFTELGGTHVTAGAAPPLGATYEFRARFPAPSTPGTVYFQVYVRAFDPSLPGTTRTGWLVTPSSARGEALDQIAVPSVSTGVRVQLSTPVATNELLVAVDGAGLSPPRIARVTGAALTAATLVMGVPAGGPYRVRAVAVDPRATKAAPILIATGKTEGVSVAASALTDVSVGLAPPPAVQISAPSSVTAGDLVTIEFTYTDPGAALDRPGVDGGVGWSTSPFADGGGTRVSASLAEEPSPGVYVFTVRLPAPSTPGTIYFQVYARTFDLSLPGISRSGWFLDPSSARGEAPEEIVVE